ncbi:hypothetical protein LEMLEM_LOCUS16559 [Lemmus lemmus]
MSREENFLELSRVCYLCWVTEIEACCTMLNSFKAKEPIYGCFPMSLECSWVKSCLL